MRNSRRTFVLLHAVIFFFESIEAVKFFNAAEGDVVVVADLDVFPF